MRHNYMPAVDLVKKLPYVNVKKSNEKTASLGGEQVSFKKELGIQSLNPERKLELWDYIKNEFDSFRDFSG